MISSRDHFELDLINLVSASTYMNPIIELTYLISPFGKNYFAHCIDV